MQVTVRDLSMMPLLILDDVIEVEPGSPVPDGRVCLVRYGKKESFRRVFKKGEFYCLKPLNPDWNYAIKYIHVEMVEIFVISEVSRVWLNLRFKRRKVSNRYW